MSRELRSPGQWLLDILQAANKIMKFTKGLDQETFCSDELVHDAVLRNLEVIGEAAAKLPLEITELAPETEWHRIRGLRNHLAHAYFGLDDDIIWDVVTNKVPGAEGDRIRGGEGTRSGLVHDCGEEAHGCGCAGGVVSEWRLGLRAGVWGDESRDVDVQGIQHRVQRR